MTPLRVAGLFVAGCVAVGTAAGNYLTLDEAYGSGPPYYGRTTNLDKWSDPLPDLLKADAVAAVASAVLVVGSLRGRRGPRRGG